MVIMVGILVAGRQGAVAVAKSSHNLQTAGRERARLALAMTFETSKSTSMTGHTSSNKATPTQQGHTHSSNLLPTVPLTRNQTKI